jgi:hypothetical protein
VAEIHPLHIKSTTPGMVWRIGSNKQPGKPARVSAYEGRDTGEGLGGWSCDLMNCRKFHREVDGSRATRRALTDAVRLLLLEMHATGAINPWDAIPAPGLVSLATA